MPFIVLLVGFAVMLESHSTTPGIWVGLALTIAGLLAGVLEDR